MFGFLFRLCSKCVYTFILVDVSDKLKKVRKELNQARDNAKTKIDSFNRVRDQRKQLFLRAFKRIAKNLTSIYSELTRDVNVLKLVRYVRHKASKDLQFLVISLKEQFFVHSDLLVGVCREPDSQSKSFHLLLEEFPESDESKKALISKGDDETETDGKTSATSGSSESEND
ncbi:hypothetical protein ACTFIY_007460 [Dictyostelium cf. discoideum]